MYPTDLKYLKSHEWVKVDGKAATLGISSFAVEQVKDIIFLELPKVGAEIKAGAQFGSLESVKAVFELNSPVSGKVTAVNEALAAAPDTVSKSPYADGWMVKLELSDPGELNGLMDSAAYEAFLKAEGAGH